MIYGYKSEFRIVGALCKRRRRFRNRIQSVHPGSLYGAKGRGAYCNHTRRLRVSGRDIGQSLIEFGAGSTHKEQADGNFALVKEIFKHCLDIRRICSSALDLCYIAAGRIDGYFEKLLHPWDIAAGYLILREAGGQATDYSGGRLQFAEQTSLVASNGVIHTYLLDTIRKYNG